MCKILVSILLAVCVALPSWARFTDCSYVSEIEWNDYQKTSVTLQCDTTANDTVWSLLLEGWVDKHDVLLIKTGDGKVLKLEPYAEKFDRVTDSIGHSPVTGELIDYYHHEAIEYYHITTTALEYISQHGISKLRCGFDSCYKDIVYKHNEFGKKLTKAYKRILERLSPDYVPPKRPSILDGF